MASVQPNLHPDPSAIRLKASAVAVRLALDAAAAQWRVAASAVQLSAGDVGLDKGGFVLQRDVVAASDDAAMTAYPRWSDAAVAGDDLQPFSIEPVWSDIAVATDDILLSFVSFLDMAEAPTAADLPRFSVDAALTDVPVANDAHRMSGSMLSDDYASASDTATFTPTGRMADAVVAGDVVSSGYTPAPTADAASGADASSVAFTKALSESLTGAADSMWVVKMAGSVINEFEFNGGLV